MGEEHIPHVLRIAGHSSGFLYSTLLLPWEQGPWGQRAQVQLQPRCSSVLCTCGGAVVFSPWVISSQPREALPEEDGAGEQLHLTLVAVVLSGPNGFFWVDTSALMLVDPEGLMLLSLSRNECPAPS